MNSQADLEVYLLRSGYENVLWSDLEDYKKHIGSSEFYCQFRSILNSDNEQLVSRAIEAVVVLREPSLQQPLVELLRHKEAVIRIEAIEGLVGLEASEELYRILDLKEDGDYLVRSYVYWAVGILGSLKDVSLLKHALKDEVDATIQSSIVAAITRLTNDTIYLNRLFEYLKDEDYHVRSLTVNALADLNTAVWQKLIVHKLRELKQVETTPAVLSSIQRVLSEI